MQRLNKKKTFFSVSVQWHYFIVPIGRHMCLEHWDLGRWMLQKLNAPLWQFIWSQLYLDQIFGCRRWVIGRFMLFEELNFKFFPFFRYISSNNSIFRIIILRFLNICIKHYCCCSSIWVICDSYLLSIASKFSFGLKSGSRFVI